MNLFPYLTGMRYLFNKDTIDKKQRPVNSHFFQKLYMCIMERQTCD